MAEIGTDRISFYKDNNWYYLEDNMLEIPYEILRLNSDISTAVGGTVGFVNINSKLRNGAKSNYFTFLQVSTNAIMLICVRSTPNLNGWTPLNITKTTIKTDGSGNFLL
jgi:hypothetical protein